mmetsp:Transcript_7713/g.17615  ORF Transcript_7713/g.17615 Transcript_7713/m.17615 type:complete len:312 (+) Transcript_7713:1570-2505(+)
MLIVVVVGTTPSSQNFEPKIALIREDLPALNSPTTTTEKSRTSRSFMSSSRVISLSFASSSARSSHMDSMKAVSSFTSASTLSPCSGAAVALPASLTASSNVISLINVLDFDSLTAPCVLGCGCFSAAGPCRSTSNLCQNFSLWPTGFGMLIESSMTGSFSNDSASPSISFCRNALVHSSLKPSVFSHCTTSSFDQTATSCFWADAKIPKGFRPIRAGECRGLRAHGHRPPGTFLIAALLAAFHGTEGAGANERILEIMPSMNNACSLQKIRGNIRGGMAAKIRGIELNLSRLTAEKTFFDRYKSGSHVSR